MKVISWNVNGIRSRIFNELISSKLKNPKDILKAVDDLITKNSILNKEIEVFQKSKSKQLKLELKNKIEPHNGFNLLGEIVELDGGSIKDILFQLKGI